MRRLLEASVCLQDTQRLVEALVVKQPGDSVVAISRLSDNYILQRILYLAGCLDTSSADQSNLRFAGVHQPPRKAKDIGPAGCLMHIVGKLRDM